MLQSTDVHMVSDSEGDDFEDAPEFGVEESEIFGMGSSSCRKSLMSKFYSVISSGVDREGNVCIDICIDQFINLFTVPENSENEGDALLHFTAEFSRRWDPWTK